MVDQLIKRILSFFLGLALQFVEFIFLVLALEQEEVLFDL